MGALLLVCTRDFDIACRYGGDEFTLILPGAPLGVRGRAEELRSKVKELKITTPDQLGVTLPLGVFRARGVTREGLMATCDEALYRAKTEGRDRVVVAGSLPLVACVESAFLDDLS